MAEGLTSGGINCQRWVQDWTIARTPPLTASEDRHAGIVVDKQINETDLCPKAVPSSSDDGLVVPERASSDRAGSEEQEGNALQCASSTIHGMLTTRSIGTTVSIRRRGHPDRLYTSSHVMVRTATAERTINAPRGYHHRALTRDANAMHAPYTSLEHAALSRRIPVSPHAKAVRGQCYDRHPWHKCMTNRRGRRSARKAIDRNDCISHCISR